MDEKTLRETIKNHVRNNPGIKGIQLIVEIMSQEIGESEIDLPDLICCMVEDGELREEEYTDPAIPYRTKSKYFPS